MLRHGNRHNMDDQLRSEVVSETGMHEEIFLWLLCQRVANRRPLAIAKAWRQLDLLPDYWK